MFYFTRNHGLVLEHYKRLNPKPKNTDGLKKVFELIRNQLPQDSVKKSILSFTKTHQACVKGGMDISRKTV